MNRGSESYGSWLGAGVWASMRPRFMNRGSVTITSSASGASRSFNEAPIHESGKSRLNGAFTPAPNSLQ